MKFGRNALIFLVSMVLGIVASLGTSLAHEYWIAPVDFTPPLGTTLAAHLKVGSDFKGDRLPMIPQFSRGYQAVDGLGIRELEGQAGERPALNIETRTPGLMVVTYQTSRSRVTFEEWEKFETYLLAQGMPQIAEAHHARGLPETDFTELYSRYAKSLVAVDGVNEGNDQATGMVIELVALDNPYALAAGDQMRIQLLWQGAPLADRQIKIFAQGDNLTVSTMRTNDQGQISISTEPNTQYLLGSIHIEPIDPVRGKETWESFWASLTFQTPTSE